MTPALTHQVVLVTGANQGLGFHTAKHLSKIAGWTVLLGSRDAKRGQTAVDQIKEEGAVAEVVPVELDITSDTSIEAIRSLIEEKHGRLDALVVRWRSLYFTMTLTYRWIPEQCRHKLRFRSIPFCSRTIPRNIRC